MAEGEHQDLLFKEGPLLKRQRGLNHRSLRNLKFQDRVCRLTSACLEYYEKRRLKGRFELERIRIVAEAGPFGRHQYCFQIGDEAEVMYFAAKSAEERDEWMKQFRQAAFGNGNKMLSHYHKGAYGLLINNRWSCCGSSQRMTSGCVPATGLHPLCHRSNSMVAAGVHGGHGHVKRKRTHLNAISENFNHRTLPRSYHPSSPSGSYDTTCSNTEDEAVSESCPPLPAGFSSVSNSPYNSRRVMRSTSYESIDTLLSEDSGRGLTLCSSWSSSQATLSSSAENLLSVVRPTQKKSQSEQSVSVNTQRAKAKQQASGVSHPSIPADPQVLSVPVMQMHATPPLGSPSEDNEAKEEEEEEEGGDKADPLSADKPQYPALFTAFFSDNYKAMKNILEQGADPDEAEPLESARSVLHHACAKGCVDIVELLLKHKANVNLRDGSGNLPLTEACKNGNMAIVEMLLASGAQVDLEGANGRTPLHEAANASHCDVIKVLISKQADPMLRDSSNDMPYDRAFRNDDKEVMEILQQSLPLNQRPYMFLGSHTLDIAREITTLTFRGLKDVLVSGSKDCRVHVWDAPSLTVTKEIPVPNTVLGVDTWMQYLAVGSTTVELFNMNDWDWKMALTDHNQGNSRSENPPLHLLAFTPTGHLATASVESNTIKLWPPPHPGLTPGNELTPEASIPVGRDQESGCICSLSASPNSRLPWMAVGFQPGKQFQPVGNKILYLINWMSQKVCYTIDTGRGGLAVGLIVTFSPDGRHLAIGCGSTLSIWETESGSELHKSDIENGTPISSLCYSPSDIHLAVGLSTGEVQVNGVNSNICIFSLGNLKNPSAATTVAYSKDGSLLGVGHADGTLQLWKAHTGCIPSDVRGAAEARSEIATTLNLQIPNPSLEKRSFIEPKLARKGTVVFDSSGGRYCSVADDFSLIVPEGAVQERLCSIEYGVIPHGPCSSFEFPDGWSSVSPIVWFCSTPGVEFSKPISITLPHYLDIRNGEEGLTLAFLKASHDDYTTNKKNEKVFNFRPVEEETSTSPRSHYGTLDTTHFCYYCLAAHRRADTSEARFFLVTAKPVFTESKHWKIFFCLVYFLETCLRLVEEQVAEEFEEGYELSYREVKFAEEGPNAGLEIRFNREIPGGWIITRESAEKVYANEVDFWDMPSCSELKLRCERKLYPPRFVLKVSGDRAIRSSAVRVDFQGSSEDLSTEIPLMLPETAPTPMSEAPINVCESSQKAAPKAFQKLFGSLCRSIDPLALAVDLLSEGIVDDEAVQKTLKADVREFNKAAELLLVVKKAIEVQPNHFETVCRVLECESNRDVQRLRAEFDRNCDQVMRSRNRGSSCYSGGSGDGGSMSDASTAMASLNHPVQQATSMTLSTDGHSGYIASEGAYFNGHRSSWGSSVSPQYHSSTSSPFASYSGTEHSLSQATPVVPAQEHGDFSSSEEPNRGLAYPRRIL